MSKYDDDEFKNVKKGVPTGGATQKASANFLAVFTIVGLIFALVIILFQDIILSGGRNLSKNGYVPEQVIINAVLALLVGGIQAWIFKAKISSRVYIFVGFSMVGGALAGLIGGLLINSGMDQPIIVGLVTGGVAGGISSFGQNTVMGNQKYGTKWLVYSAISWAVIFSIGWTIGWQASEIIWVALAAAFLMIANGVSLVIFLVRTPELEFS